MSEPVGMKAAKEKDADRRKAQKRPQKPSMSTPQGKILSLQRAAGNRAVSLLPSVSAVNVREDPLIFTQAECMNRISGFPGEPGFPSEQQMAAYNRECRMETGYAGPELSYQDLKETRVADISAELRDAPLSSDPMLRVKYWLQNHVGEIESIEKKFNIDRRAIAGAIAWEALENIPPWYKPLWAGRAVETAGKPHMKQGYFPSGLTEVLRDLCGEYKFVLEDILGEHEKVPAEEVELLDYLPRMKLAQRVERMKTPEGAVERIGAILAAYADTAERHGYCIRTSVPMLLNCYNGFKTNIKGWDKYLENEKNPSEELRWENPMAVWAAQNLSYLEDCVGKMSLGRCESFLGKKRELRRKIRALEEEKFLEQERTAGRVDPISSERSLAEIEVELESLRRDLVNLEGIEREDAFLKKMQEIQKETGIIDATLACTPSAEISSQSDPESLERARLMQERRDFQAMVDRSRAGLVRERFSRRIEMTPSEITEMQTYIEGIEVETNLKADLYEELQKQVQYLSQRSNELAETDEGGTCNLTSLAMSLMYLGVPNPHPEILYPDALESIRIENHLPARTNVWPIVDHLGIQHGDIGSNIQQSRAWYEENVRDAHLRQGHAVMLSTGGHIVRLEAVTEKGLVVDDPYGKTKLHPGTAIGWTRTNPRRVDDPVGPSYPGENVTWPWSDLQRHTVAWIRYLKR